LTNFNHFEGCCGIEMEKEEEEEEEEAEEK